MKKQSSERKQLAQVQKNKRTARRFARAMREFAVNHYALRFA